VPQPGVEILAVEILAVEILAGKILAGKILASEFHPPRMGAAVQGNRSDVMTTARLGPGPDASI
jgi:hypothetical protein